MKTKARILLPFLLAAVILASCVGGWLWYDNNVDRSGWVEKDGVRFYRDFHADPVSGWLELEEGTYYFREDGTPHTGWQEIDGITYFFTDAGIMHTGWLEDSGKLYYFGSNGTMVVGWLWLDEGRYYLQDGALLIGWQEIDGGRYHFNEDGIAAIGFAEVDGKQYYFAEGIMVTGETTIDGKQYYFQEDGVLLTGWQESEAGTRYYHSDGTMATDWTEIEGKRYYFAEEGYLHTGWLEQGEYRYYLHSDGAAAVGPTEIDGQTHYFTPKGIEVILVNALNPVPSYYQRDLVNVVDYHDVDRRCYDALIRMLADCEAAGIKYTFNSAYRTEKEQTMILEYRTLEYMRDYDMTFVEARAKALETVAIPGTSEHHLGLAVDLLGDDAIAWFREHCWEYGFIIRYTAEKEGITGIVDEPWHFRYVGVEVSMDMKGTGLSLEEYVGAEPVTPDAVTAYYGDTWYREVFTTVDQKTIAKYIGNAAANYVPDAA